MPSNQKESSSFENMKDTSRAVDIDITENFINIIQIYVYDIIGVALSGSKLNNANKTMN